MVIILQCIDISNTKWPLRFFTFRQSLSQLQFHYDPRMRKIHNVRCVYTILPAVFFVCTLVHCEPLFFPILIQSFYLVRHILFHFRINIPRNDFQSCTFRPGNVWNIKDYISKQINAEQKINTEEKDPKQRLLAAFILR